MLIKQITTLNNDLVLFNNKPKSTSLDFPYLCYCYY